MNIQNVSGVVRYIPDADVVVDVGEVFEVGDDLGASLLEQPANWAAQEEE